MSATTPPIAKFRVGRIMTTPNALAHLTQDDVLHGLQRHQAGAWAMWTNMIARPMSAPSLKEHASGRYIIPSLA